MMLRPILRIAAGLAALAAAGGAHAQALPAADAVSDQLTVRGRVDAGCVVGAPLSPTASNATVQSAGPGSADVSITQLVDDQGQSIGATVVMILPATCNQAHKLTLISPNGGLVSDAPALAAGPFRALLPYSVTVDRGGAPVTWSSSDAQLDVDVGDAALGPVTLTIQIPAGGAPLSAGVYADQLIIEFGVTG